MKGNPWTTLTSTQRAALSTNDYRGGNSTETGIPHGQIPLYHGDLGVWDASGIFVPNMNYNASAQGVQAGVGSVGQFNNLTLTVANTSATGISSAGTLVATPVFSAPAGGTWQATWVFSCNANQVDTVVQLNFFGNAGFKATNQLNGTTNSIGIVNSGSMLIPGGGPGLCDITFTSSSNTGSIGAGILQTWLYRVSA
jgi:hypothetical protein